MNDSIPKIIHRIWFDLGKTPKPDPKKYGVMMKSVDEFHKKDEWEFYTWDEDTSDKFVRKHYPQYYHIYNQLVNKMMKVDAIRFFILHCYGGYYIDQDLELYKSLDHIALDYPDKKVFVSRLNNWIVGTKTLSLPPNVGKRLLNNFFFASVPRHPLWIDLIESIPIKSSWNKFEHSIIGILKVAGPLHVTSVVRRRHKENKQDDIQILPDRSFLPKKDEQKLYGKHMYHSEWLVSNNRTFEIIVGGCIISTFVIVVAALCCVILKIRHKRKQ